MRTWAISLALLTALGTLRASSFGAKGSKQTVKAFPFLSDNKMSTNIIVHGNGMSDEDINKILKGAREIDVYRTINGLGAERKIRRIDELIEANPKRVGLYFPDQKRENPSTRTYSTFQNAAHVLGMAIVTSGAYDLLEQTAMARGESAEDLMYELNHSLEAMIVREREYVGIDVVLSEFASPYTGVIGAGDGRRHLTQAISDVYTVSKERNLLRRGGIKTNALEGETLVLSGNIGQRTHRSVGDMFSRFGLKRLMYVSENKMDEVLHDTLVDRGVKVTREQSLKDTLSKATILYLIDLPKSIADQGLLPSYQVTNDLLSKSLDTTIVLHPFPRTSGSKSEAPTSIDDNRKVRYFTQSDNLSSVRPAIMALLPDERERSTAEGFDDTDWGAHAPSCPNGDCYMNKSPHKIKPKLYSLESNPKRLICAICETYTVPPK